MAGECDFIVIEKEHPKYIYQSCYNLNQNNLDRELNGAFEFLRFFRMKQATIVTMEQRDRFEEDGLIVEVVPAHEFLMNHRF